MIMSEEQPNSESEPECDPYGTFENLVGLEQWLPDTKEKLRELLETHEVDMYMIYLNYTESELVDELPEHERQIYEYLKNVFEGIDAQDD